MGNQQSLYEQVEKIDSPPSSYQDNLDFSDMSTRRNPFGRNNNAQSLNTRLLVPPPITGDEPFWGFPDSEDSAIIFRDAALIEPIQSLNDHTTRNTRTTGRTNPTNTSNTATTTFGTTSNHQSLPSRSTSRINPSASFAFSDPFIDPSLLFASRLHDYSRFLSNTSNAGIGIIDMTQHYDRVDVRMAQPLRRRANAEQRENKKKQQVKKSRRNKIPTFKYKKKKECPEEECCICLVEYRSNNILRRLKCCHQFHKKCIDEWLDKVEECPMCRKSID